MKEETKDYLLSGSLLLAGVIWGLGFIAVEYALIAGVMPSVINAVRFSVAAVFVCLVFWKQIRTLTLSEFKKGVIPGLFMMGGFLLQGTSQSFTTPSNVAFITALYIVFVPIFSKIVLKHKVGLQRILAAVITFAGIGILSLGSIETGTFGIGEILAFCGAVVFAMHFISLERPSREVSPVKLTFIQMFVAAIALWIYAIVFDFESLQNISEINVPMATIAILYLGTFSSFGAYLIQTNAQKHVSASKTAILMSTECPLGSTFSVMFGFDTFTFYLLIGGIITMVGVLMTEVKIYWFDKAERKLRQKLNMKEADGLTEE
ncbi:MAG: DMT family transporter [Bacillota bacterium]